MLRIGSEKQPAAREILKQLVYNLKNPYFTMLAKIEISFYLLLKNKINQNLNAINKLIGAQKYEATYLLNSGQFETSCLAHDSQNKQ